MKQKLAYALALAAVLNSPLSKALSLGDIVVDSNVNEPLRATIEIGSTRNISTERILVQMAASADFRKANIEKPFHLSDISFKVEQGPRGKVLRLSSSKKITEPYLNFILDTRWPNGRVLREYLVLLDLPVHSASTNAASAIDNATSVAGTVKPAPEKEVYQPAPIAAVANGAATGSNSARQAAAQATNQAANPSTTVAQKHGTYTVRSNDTLWEIAASHKAPNATVEQAMHAMFTENPEAFLNANINQLKKGAILRIPAEREQSKIAQRDAKSWQRNQYSAWKNSKSAPANLKQALDASQPSSQLAKSAAQTEGHLTLTSKLESEQHLARAEKSLAEQADGEVLENGESNGDLVSALEQLDRKTLEHDALEDSYVNLQERFGQLEKLIVLKNAQLAELSASIQKSEDFLAELEGESGSSVPAVVDDSVVDDSIAPEYLAVAEAEIDAEVDELNPEQEGAGEEQLSLAAIPAKAQIVEGAGGTPDGGATPPPVSPTPPPTTGAASGFVDQFLAAMPPVVQKNYPWIAGSLGGLLTILGALIVWRKRSVDGEEGEVDAEFLEQFEAAEPSAEEQAFGNQPLSPQQWSTDTDATATEEVQPFVETVEAESEQEQPEVDSAFAEIDIFLAYGHHDKAVEALKTLIAEDENNADYRLKLIDVYRESQNEVEARAEAEALIAFAPEYEANFTDLLSTGVAETPETEMVLDTTDLPAHDDLSLDSETTSEEVALDTEFVLDASLDEESSDAADSISSEASQFDEVLDLEASTDLNNDLSDIDFEPSYVGEAELDSNAEVTDTDVDIELKAFEPTLNPDALDGSESESLSEISDLEFAQSFSEIEESPMFESVEEAGETDLDGLALDAELADSSDFSTDLELEPSLPDAVAPAESSSEELSQDKKLEQDLADAYSDLSEDLLAENETLTEEASDMADTSEDVVDSLLQQIDSSLHSQDEGIAGASEELEFDVLDSENFDADDISLSVDDAGDDATAIEPLSDADLEAEYQSATEMLEQVEEASEEQADSGEANTPADSASELASDELEVEDTALGDEVATKLDLARAYLEMGDIDGAKDVLDEVIEEGSSSQQQEANQMLQKIA